MCPSIQSVLAPFIVASSTGLPEESKELLNKKLLNKYTSVASVAARLAATFQSKVCLLSPSSSCMQICQLTVQNTGCCIRPFVSKTSFCKQRDFEPCRARNSWRRYRRSGTAYKRLLWKLAPSGMDCVWRATVNQNVLFCCWFCLSLFSRLCVENLF